MIIEEFEIEEELITMTTSLTDELDINSLDLVDLVMTVEDEFSIELPDEALEGMKTIGDLVKYIEEN
jgi:acyl carrier protein